ncbi:formylglycine-generating enzyme family protein [Breznakiellaceae bacterium SP9]
MNKNKSFILGMSAMLLTFGLVLAGCNKGSSSDNGGVPLTDPRTQASGSPQARGSSDNDGVPFTYPYGIVMAAIPAGTFAMGSPSDEVDHQSDETLHDVTLSAFTMSKHEVTQAQWQAVMGSNPSFFTFSIENDKRPVERVSWYETIEFCNRLSVLAGLSPAYTISETNVTWNRSANGYRLPTEAEWEYACRAGTTTPFNTGDNITTDQANYDRSTSTVAVGTFAPNAWGLYDMHGNVWEWCWDWYGSYPSVPETDPMGAASESNRVFRGGGWNNSALYMRSAYRDDDTPTVRYSQLGFRVVRP